MILSDYKRRSPQSVKVGNTEYQNPRGLPLRWIENYLERDPKLLALDVMRAFDEAWKAKQELQSAKIKIWVMTGVIFGLCEAVKFLITLLVK